MSKRKIIPGEIRWVRFKGEFARQGGTRPALVMQNETGCIHSPRIWVIPLTTRYEKSNYPMHIFIPKSNYNNLEVDSLALVEQADFVLKEDIGDFIGKLEDKYRYQCGQAWINNCNGIFDPKIISIVSNSSVA